MVTSSDKAPKTQASGAHMQTAEPKAQEKAQAAPKKRKVKHLHNAFLTELFRSIGSSLTRFLAIMSIVGLGVGFYAGLNMTGQDMRQAADIYYDGTSLYDLRVISTLGLTDDQLTKLADVEGVDQVEGTYATDIMTLLNGDRYVMRIASCDMDAAREATTNENGSVVVSSDDGYLNRLVLAEGSWPTSADECVLSADCVMNQPIKVGDTVEVLYGTGELDDVLAVLTYKVSGLVHSSAYPSNVMLGYSNLGSGQIQQFMFVSEDAFSDALPYTEVYVTVEGARDFGCWTDEYQACVDEVAARIEDMGLGALRLAELKDSAESELSDAQNEYDEGKAEAESELSDAESELSDAESELADAESELADAYTQLEDARKAIESGQQEYDDGVRQLEEARAEANRQLADARAQLESARSQLDSAEAQLGMSQADINAAYNELEAGAATWQTQRAQLLTARGDLSTIRASVDDAAYYVMQDRELTESEVAIVRSDVQAAVNAASSLMSSGLINSLPDDAQATTQQLVNEIVGDFQGIDYTQPPEQVIAQMRGMLPTNVSRIDSLTDSSIAQIDAGIAEGDNTIATYRSQLSQAQSARDEIDAGWAEYNAGLATYNQSEADANAQLAAAQQTLDEAAAELADAQRQYEEGQKEYEEGQKEYEEGYNSFLEGYATYVESRDEVEVTFGDAASQLAAARSDIDSLEEPTIYVLDRTKGAGLVTYMDDTYRVDSIASVFPFLFFLVAALVSLTTMTRMVEDERADIGTHKALGFSTARITAKYVAYAGLAGITGSLIGILILSQLLPWVVQVAYHIMYSVPVLPFPQPIDLGISFLSTALGLGVTFIVIFAAAAATLREVPATLMLPRAPKAGKRILLERAGFIWKNLSFSWKVTFRNLFRYKQRLVMTVVGVAGCTALLLTGFGLYNAIWDIIAYQNESENQISNYNITVGLEAGVTSADTKAIEAVLADLGEASDFEYFDLANMQISAGSGDADASVSVHIVTDPDEFAKMVDLRERKSKQPIEFTQDSVVLTEKMANKLGVGVGDTIKVYERDELGNPTGDGYELTLTGVCENYVYHWLYVGDAAWKDATGEPCAVDTMYSIINDREEIHKELVAELSDTGAVASVEFVEEAIDSYRTSLQAVNIIVVVLVVAAAALDFIVLYNLINIQLIERTREIASLKVLGFNRREVANYLFRETIILVIVGALVGLALGTVMEGFVVVTAEVDAVMFGRDIHFMSYVYAFSLSILFSLLVMVFVMPKLRQIDMVESLKSVD